MATDYRSLLAQPAENVERPKPLPNGNYIGTLGQYEFGKARSGTDRIRFPIALAEACGDVDASQLIGIDVTKKEVRRDYYITPDALFWLTDMVDAVLGKKPGVNVDERLPDLRGQKVMVSITQRASEQNAEQIFNDVNLIVAAP